MKELTDKLKKQGYRVFLADSGTYGFYTNELGSKLVSFQIDLGVLSFSGNYKTDNGRQTGTGWRITANDTGDYKAIFNTPAPHWAVGDSKWQYTTLKQHLDTYQKSSKYNEL